MVHLSANLSTLFRDLPQRERFQAAADAGFTDVEMWWQYPGADASAEVVDELVDDLARSGTRLTGLNLFAGDMASGDRGVLSWPNARDGFAVNVAAVTRIAEATGCRQFNALYGQRLEGFSSAQQEDCSVSNLALAATALAELGGTILIEALKYPDNGEYPIRTLDDADRIRRRVADEHGSENVRLLVDTFHLAANGVDVPAAIRRHGDQVGHVQLADSPGRGEPGTGTVDFAAVLSALDDVGYRGLIALEYLPTTLVSRERIEAGLEQAS